VKVKQWSKSLIIYGIVSLCIILLFNYSIDPFQHYRKAKIYTFNYSGNQRYLNPGLAKNYDFNSIIIGTSMTENFTLDRTKMIMHNPIKLSIAGGKAYEFKQILEIAFASHNIQTVLFGLDVYSFLNIKESYDGLPDYLCDDNFFNDYKYLLHFDTLKRAFKVLFSKDNNKNQKDYNYNHMFEWQAFNQKNFTLGNVIDNWNNRDKLFKHQKNLWNFQELKNNFDESLYKIIAENKNINFILFFPPYSALTYKDWEEKDSLNTILEFKEYMYNKLAALENVSLYDFQIAKEITHNLNNYKDITHYSQDINYWIIDQIYYGNFLITPENQKQNLIFFFDQIKNYNITF